MHVQNIVLSIYDLGIQYRMILEVVRTGIIKCIGKLLVYSAMMSKDHNPCEMTKCISCRQVLSGQ